MSSPLRLRCVLFGTGQIVRFTGKARRIRRALRRRLVQPVSSTGGKLSIGAQHVSSGTLVRKGSKNDPHKSIIDPGCTDPGPSR